MIESNVIEVRNAVKVYDSEKILDNLHLNVKRGSIYALLGSSGCGKTTLLSCIVGTKKLDSGTIKVFDNLVGKNKSRIGYMPQDSAIIDEFTIKEMIFFFGTIYGLNQQNIKNRFHFLMNLFELPDGEAFVKNCSGGEKRRISLAVCLVHQPEILILDEPTVGLDPLLRFKIWNFLESITKSGETTVIITTHYIEEAKQANCVGLLRNGVLVAEDSPTNLLSQTKTENLEETFVKLCESQDRKFENSKDFNGGNEKTEDFESVQSSSSSFSAGSSTTLSNESFGKKFMKLKALTRKNFLQTIRRPAALSFLIFTPFLCLVSFYSIIGSNPIGLKLGVVNHEVQNFSECSDPLLLMTTVHGYNCYVNKVSCRFLNRLNDSIATKHFYENFDDAYDDVKHGKLNGFIQFSENFTSSLHPLNEWQDNMENHTENGEIQIFLDQSDRQITFFLKQKLFDVFEEFTENLMQDCGKSRKSGSAPIRIETLFGSLKDEMQRSMTPGIIVTIYFFVASMITSTAFISDRLDGVWNRVLLAGVEPIEFFLSHIIFNSLIVVLQSVEFHIVVTYFFNFENLGSYWLVMTLILLVGLSAIIFGLAVSILSNDFMTATFSSTLIFYPMIIMCGIFWPLEAIPWYFRYLAYCLPFTLPTVALRNILYKGYSLADLSVQVGFSVIILWLLFSLTVCFIGLKSKKFFGS